VVSASRVEQTKQTDDGLRPINLRTDLADLADLIELVFANNMDSGGRAALREMRYLSRMGYGLNLISRINDLALGVSLGHVWVADGKLIGNVSVYPADWPKAMGSTWIIANVGVHPDYQRRGIARALMNASMQMIQRRGGKRAILQVDVENEAARGLYRSLGFVEERAWTTWRRNTTIPPQPSTVEQGDLYLRHRRRGEWRDELALARRTRPQERGGLGWLRPLHPHTFHTPWWKHLRHALNLTSMEYLVLRSPQEQQVKASLWIKTALGGRTELTLLVDPSVQGHYDDVLLNNIVRRFNRSPLVIEHPSDETLVNQTLERYRFIPQRSVLHMRWEAP
jgi:ribosomal protein S18 acetylase RimI-like enzyme